jgi:phospholipase C
MSNITNVFVLMLENRSFDHMLGFSGLTGNDAVTGKPTSINGASSSDSNSYQATSYPASSPAPWVMPVDPGHEFLDVLTQLAGPGSTYAPGGAYPPINNSGFVADYVSSPSANEGNAPQPYGNIMACFAAAQLPVLNTLAQNFAVCDSWFSSLPGPTWPNRFFVHAASSGGLDHSPTSAEIVTWETVDGFTFPNGTIFDRLNKAKSKWKLYSAGSVLMTNVGALKGISFRDISSYSKFAGDVMSSSYPWSYTFIEPDYGDLSSFANGNSQHPLDGVTNGELLIQQTYEVLRNSPLWATSLLIITWDEHGGFYDHIAPPAALPPNDGSPSKYNQYGFTFAQYGVRVPAVVVSPLIPENVIDHRAYDHSSVPATLEALFNLKPLTQRDGKANNLASLCSLSSPRDTPTTLPNPAAPPASALAQTSLNASAGDAQSGQTVDHGNLPGFLHVAMKHDIELTPDQRDAILNRVKAIQTRGEAQDYIERVGVKLRSAKRQSSQTS